MPTTDLLERRKWYRLPVSIPAAFTVDSRRAPLNGHVLDLNVNGIGFTLVDNVQGVAELQVAFWLPFDEQHPNDAMLEPIVARLTPVCSRYSTRFETYGYGAVFIALAPRIRIDIERFVERATSKVCA